MAKNSSLAREHRAHARHKTIGWTVIAVSIFVSLVVLKPSLPKKIVLLTGPEDGGYHALGERYATILRGRGLRTEVVVTDGGVDNLQRLRHGAENTIGFVPSNLENAIAPPIDADGLVSLGSVGYEPLWLFYRTDLEVGSLGDLAFLTVGTGDDNSVVGWLGSQLLEINGIRDSVDFVGEAGSASASPVEALLGGGVDGVFAMGIPTAPAIEELLLADGVSMLSFNRADAYVARTPGLTKLVAPEGVFDLARNRPPEDAQLLAATTNLVADKSLPPSVVSLLLAAARSLHENQRILSQTFVFPSRHGVSLPLDRAAARFYEEGESGLTKHVPYAVARKLRHFGGVVLPLIVLTVVVVKFLPILLKIWITVRLAGFFKRLEAVEKADAAGEDRADLLTQLQAIDDASATIFVPRSKLAEYIDFRQFVHDMRDRIMSGDERKLKEEGPESLGS